MNGTGILSLGNGCIVFNQKFRLEAQALSKINKNMEYVVSNFKPINVNEKVKQKNVIANLDLGKLNQNFDNIREKLKYEEMLEKVKIQTDESIESTSDSFHLSFSIILVLIAMIVGTLYFLKIKSQGASSNSIVTFINENYDNSNNLGTEGESKDGKIWNISS